MKRFRRDLFHILEGTTTNVRLARAANAFLVVLILLSVAAVALETVPSISARYVFELHLIDAFTVAIFTVEYALRVWVASEHPSYGASHPWKSRLAYMRSPLALIDLLAILPFYLAPFLSVDLRVLRLFRLLRILKLTRYSPALGTMAEVLRNERKSVFGALCILAVLLIFSSAVIYYVEHEAQPDAFGSIPAAMWWAMSTLTTVGYGDVAPVTTAGRIVGSFVMMLGIGVFVMWTSIFASGFLEEIRKRSFVVTWRMVAQVPLFADLDAQRIAEIASLLAPETMPSRYTIMRRGEPGVAMYFIVSGEVEVDLYARLIKLGPGQYFGELSLLAERARSATVVTLTDCQLLRLDAKDFRRLMEAEPVLKDAIAKTAEERHWSDLDEMREVDRVSRTPPQR